MNQALLSLAVVALICAAIPALAQSQKTDIRPIANQIMGSDINAHFSGKTHDGAYNFSRDGKARSFYVESHSPSGDVTYQEGEIRSKGIWFVRRDSLCFAYENDSMAGGCFRVYRVKNCDYYYSDRIPQAQDELDRDYWTARSTLKGETPECDAPMT